MSDDRRNRWLYSIAGVLTAAADVKRMLWERPSVAGIGVGGMPTGSPGMPGIPEPYTVEAFSGDGATVVYAEH